MGKPLSRPDCLRRNPPCVGKGEEEEDLNIEDCYVPQRSIYDTVRLNEQIDSGSKGSLSSRHFTDRTLPYSHRTLDVSSLCSNGALSSSSIFELRGREANKLDEKMIFDALKLNSDVIRGTGLPKPKSQAEKREHRRSWRMFVPANFMDYANKSESSFVEPSEDGSDAVRKASKGRWGTNSQTSEEDDSGLCSPPAEREEKPGLVSGEQPAIRSLSSVEDMHTSDQERPFFSASSVSEQKIPLLSCRSAQPSDNFQMILQDASPLRGAKCVSGQRSLHSENSCVQNPLRESAKCIGLVVPRDGANKGISNSEDQERTLRQGESQTPAHSRECRKEPLVDLALSPTDLLEEQQGDFGSTALLENVTLLTHCDSEECSMASKGRLEAPFSAQEIEVTQKKSPLQFIQVKKKTGPRKTGVQAGSSDAVCNGFQLVQVTDGIETPPQQPPVVLFQSGQE